MIHVEFGNHRPHTIVDGRAEPLQRVFPVVTYVNIPDEAYTHTAGLSGRDLLLKLAQGQHTPEHEIFENLLHRDGQWAAHSSEPPSWVWSDDEDLERLLSEAYGCPRGRPSDVEETHHTLSGPPGVGTSEG